MVTPDRFTIGECQRRSFKKHLLDGLSRFGAKRLRTEQDQYQQHQHYYRTNHNARYRYSPSPVIRARPMSGRDDIFPHQLPSPHYKYEPHRTWSLDQILTFRKALAKLILNNDGRLMMLTPDEKRLVVDCGASCTITHDLNDFIEPPRPVANVTLQGIG